MTTRVAIDVIFTKYIEVEVPGIKGTQDEEIIDKAVEAETAKLPADVNGFFANWTNYEEV